MSHVGKHVSFDRQLKEIWDKGICSGEVVYSRATSSYATDQGNIPFEARYLPCLDKKPTSRSPSPEREEGEGEQGGEGEEDTGEALENKGIGEQCEAIENDPGPRSRKESASGADPFAAPRDNVVLEMEDYTCVLNKYALEPGHFLVVTNEFYPQKGPLRPADLEMIYETLQGPDERHYCFFNGGVLAGASQEHRHFQFLPVPKLPAPCWPDQIHHHYKANGASSAHSGGGGGDGREDDEPRCHPNIPAHHFLLPITDSSTRALVRSFEILHSTAKRTVQFGRTNGHEKEDGEGAEDAVEEKGEEEMSYNFLMTKEYMLLFPRRNEEWDQHAIGVGGTCLVGSIMVSKQRDLETVREIGLCRMLAHVGFPKSTAPAAGWGGGLEME